MERREQGHREVEQRHRNMGPVGWLTCWVAGWLVGHLAWWLTGCLVGFGFGFFFLCVDSGNPGLPGLWRTSPDLGTAVNLGIERLTVAAGIWVSDHPSRHEGTLNAAALSSLLLYGFFWFFFLFFSLILDEDV